MLKSLTKPTKLIILPLALAAILSAPLSAQEATKTPLESSEKATSYTLSPASHIGFKTKKLGFVNVEGVFKKFSGSLKLDSNNKILALSGEVIIDSIFSNSAKRDKHLLEEDYFNAPAFPKGHFEMRSYNIISQDEKSTKAQITGNLTLHGITREIVFQSELIANPSDITLNLESKTNIKDFNMQGSKIASDDVEIIIKTKWVK